MKRIFKKNQIIVTMLAVLIAVAGYLNYADNKVESGATKKVNMDTYESVYEGDELLSGNEDIVSLDENVTQSEGETALEDETQEPGMAILTNGSSLSSYMVQARLDREQTRSKNKETLQEVINNTEIGDADKQKAVETMVEITKICEMENNIETLLKAKGFSDIIVTISNEQADVIVSEGDIDEAKRAQIEDVIKRKAGISMDNITITPTSTEEVEE